MKTKINNHFTWEKNGKDWWRSSMGTGGKRAVIYHGSSGYIASVAYPSGTKFSSNYYTTLASAKAWANSH